MANTRNQNLFNTVRGTIGQLTGNRGRKSRGGRGVGSQASDFVTGFLSGGNTRSRRSRRRRR